MIRFKSLPLDETDFKAVANVLAAGSLSMGHVVSELEDRFAAYVGAKYAIATNSCTSALFLSLVYKKKFGVKDAFIPSMTVPLVANTILHAGLELGFTDNVDWVGKSYYVGTTGIVDSAHEVKPRNFGAELVCYSFYPTKPVCSCEGGMICTDDKEAVRWLRRARWYGRSDGSSKIKNSWEYDIEFPGWKMNMTDIQAAIALNQLRKLPFLEARLKAIQKYYNDRLDYKNDSLYLYRINVEKRDEFIQYAKEHNIECGVHFKPLHHFDCYPDAELPKTDEAYKTTVSLPFHAKLEDWQIDKVCQIVEQFND